MSDRGDGKRGRLTRSGDFKRAYRSGRSKASRHLIVYSFPNSGDAEGGPRLGISVGRKVGGAVERNRVKRVLRDAFWNLEHGKLAGDVVIVARPGVEDLIEKSTLGAVAAEIASLLPEASEPQGSQGGQLELSSDSEDSAAITTAEPDEIDVAGASSGPDEADQPANPDRST